MSKHAYLFLSIYGVALVAALFFPPVGIWGYLFEWYNHPTYNWWGRNIIDPFGGRWSYAIGAAMVFGLLLHYRQYKDVSFMEHKESKVMLLFTLNAFLVSIWAWEFDKSYEVAIEHLKMFVVYFCFVKTQSQRKSLSIVIFVIIFCTINWGLEATLHPGKGRSLGIGAANLSDENFVAAHAVAILPLIVLYILSEKGWIRWICLIGAPFVFNIVPLSRSRGAFLGLFSVGLSILILSRGKMRKWTIAGLVIGALIGIRLVDESSLQRLRTLKTYEEDASATGRIDAWEAAFHLFKRNPFGYGGEAFDRGLGASIMAPKVFHTTHNMFFEVLVAWGIQGVLLLYGFIFLSIKEAWGLYRKLWDRIKWPPPREAMIALGVLCGLVSMLITSSFLNRYRWELWWIYTAVIVCLKNTSKDMETKENVNS